MLIVLLCNMVSSIFMPSYSLATSIVSIVIMFCGLAVTVRRLHDGGHSAFWVYVSYGLGCATTLFSYFGLADFYQEYMEMLESGYMPTPEELVEVMAPYFSLFAIYTLLLMLWAASSVVVFVMVLMDGKPETNQWGPSPKYVPAE